MTLKFTLKLHAAYYRQGMFNSRLEFDKHFGPDGSSVEIRLPDCGKVIAGKINRSTAQNNGTARIRGAGLKDCFHEVFQMGEDVDLLFLSDGVIEIRKKLESAEV